MSIERKMGQFGAIFEKLLASVKNGLCENFEKSCRRPVVLIKENPESITRH